MIINILIFLTITWHVQLFHKALNISATRIGGPFLLRFTHKLDPCLELFENN